jgi:hypothetical protein
MERHGHVIARSLHQNADTKHPECTLWSSTSAAGSTRCTRTYELEFSTRGSKNTGRAGKQGNNSPCKPSAPLSTAVRRIAHSDTPSRLHSIRIRACLGIPLYTAHPLGHIIPIVGMPDASVVGIPPFVCGFGDEIGVFSGEGKMAYRGDHLCVEDGCV